MKKRIRIILVALIVFGLVGSSVWFWQFDYYQASNDKIVLYGNVDIRQVFLAFNGSDRIVGMLAEEGEKVKKGQLLAYLDTTRLNYVVSRAEARVQAQRNVVARLEAGTRVEEIRKAEADVEAAAAKAQYAKKTYERIQLLAANDAASQEKADDAEAAAIFAQAQLKAAKEALKLAVTGPRKEDIAAAKAALKAYEAELALARRDLAESNLYAPADGIIQARILEPGDMASPQRPVYTLALTTPLWVRAYVSEPDLGKIRLRMAADVTTDSYPEKRYKAWVGFISPTAEFTPKSVETPELRTRLVYQVRIFVYNPQGELRLGMPATVSIPLIQPSVEGSEGLEPCKTF